MWNKRTEFTTGQEGFSLLEILIVLSLITIFFGFSSFFFADRLPAARLDALGRDISAGIRHAKSLAISEGDRRYFMIDLDRRSFGVEGLPEKKIPSDITISIRDRFGGEIHQGQYAITAWGVGSIEGDTILLGTKRKKIEIRIDPILGSVILKGNGI